MPLTGVQWRVETREVHVVEGEDWRFEIFADPCREGHWVWRYSDAYEHEESGVVEAKDAEEAKVLAWIDCGKQ